MIYAVADADGVVVNMIVAPDLETAQAVAPEGTTVVDDTGGPAGIGWTLEGGELVAPPTGDGEVAP